MLTPYRLAFFVCGSLFLPFGDPALGLLFLSFLLILAFHDRLSPSTLFCAFLGWSMGQITWVDRADTAQKARWRLTVDRTTVDSDQTLVLKEASARYIWRNSDRRWCAGTVIELSGRLIPPIAQSNPGQRAPYRHQLSRGIYGQIKGVKERVKVVGLPDALQSWSCQTRQGVYPTTPQVRSYSSQQNISSRFAAWGAHT